jgi:hypothetical protein
LRNARRVDRGGENFFFARLFARRASAAKVRIPFATGAGRTYSIVTDDGITAPVKQFITEHIDSVMQLEILLLLAGQPGRVWTAADLAQQLRIDATWVDGQLRGMAAAGLVAVTEVQPSVPAPQFRYEPRTPDLTKTVGDLAHAYADRRVTVIGLIFSKPVDKIRSFADAFRLRKDKGD